MFHRPKVLGYIHSIFPCSNAHAIPYDCYIRTCPNPLFRGIRRIFVSPSLLFLLECNTSLVIRPNGDPAHPTMIKSLVAKVALTASVLSLLVDIAKEGETTSDDDCATDDERDDK